ncbi:MAG: hypothetical protein E7081_07725 [Bacteroidales bacterium]|nr:hypothetical protein [Bacteroidales bacterium]
MKRLKIWLQGLSFRTGVVVIILSVICYVISFAQILLPIGTSAKWVIWFVFFGMAKTFQYSGLAILGVAGIQRLKRFWKKKKRI